MVTEVNIKSKHTLEDKIILEKKILKKDVKEYLGEFLKKDDFEKIWELYNFVSSEYKSLKIKTDSGDNSLIHLIRTAKLVEYSSDLITGALLHDLVEDILSKYFFNQKNTDSFPNKSEEINNILMSNFCSAEHHLASLIKKFEDKFGKLGSNYFDISLNLSKFRIDNGTKRIIKLEEKKYLNQIEYIIPKLADRTENTITIEKCSVEKQKKHPIKIIKTIKYLSPIQNNNILEKFYDEKLRYNMIFELLKFLENKKNNAGKMGDQHEERRFEELYNKSTKILIKIGESHYYNYVSLLKKLAQKNSKYETIPENIRKRILVNEFVYRIKRTMVESPPIMYSLGNIERNIYFLKELSDLVSQNNIKQKDIIKYISDLAEITKIQIVNDSSRLEGEIENYERSRTNYDIKKSGQDINTNNDKIVEYLEQRVQEMKDALLRMNKAQENINHIINNLNKSWFYAR